MISIPNATREALTRALATCQPHCRPIILAVRDHGCGYGSVWQDAGPFALPIDKPAIIVLGDDLDTAKGPTAFHRPSVAAVLAKAGAAYVIASAAVESTFAQACTWPVILRRHVVIIETLPEREDEWIDLVLDANPDIALTVSKVDPTLRPEPQQWGRA